MNSEFYYNLIEKNMLRIICNDLTIGRLEDELPAFTEKEIADFIEDCSTDINEAIHEMYLDYLEEDNLETLRMPLDVWFTEYLYKYIEL